jgi:DNA-binding beta-propeller fold protein YncE
MHFKNFLSLIVLVCVCSFIQAQDLKSIEQKRVKLPNGWSLTPVGKSLQLGDLPLNIEVSASHKYAAVTNNGQSKQTIQLIDAKTDKELDNIIISKSWGGLVFSADEKFLYASGGDNNWILKYAIVNNKLIANDTIKLGGIWTRRPDAPSISPTGISIDDKNNVTNNYNPSKDISLDKGCIYAGLDDASEKSDNFDKYHK